MAKKKGKSSGAGAFDREWLEVGVGGARALVDLANERSADLVEAWVAHENVPAVLEIASDDSAPTVARKAARRGINVLKSRGVAIPERPRALAGTPDTEVVEAWFRPPDGAGTSAFTIGSRSPQGRYRMVDIIIKEGAGVVSIAGMQMSRSQLRETFEGIAKRFGSPPALVPLAWARSRVASALVANEKSETPVPLGFDTHRDLLGPLPPTPPPHPALGSKLPAVEPLEALDRSARLHAEPELRGWLPAPPAIHAMLLAIRQSLREDAPNEPSATQIKVRSAIEKATDAFFTPYARADFAERMKDAVISMAARGARDRAADLFATAEAIRLLGPDAEPHTIPFLRAFFEKAFGLATARAAAERGV